jgi:hypothetical protein
VQGYTINFEEFERRRLALELARRSMVAARLRGQVAQANLSNLATQMQSIQNQGLSAKTGELQHRINVQQEALEQVGEELSQQQADVQRQMSLLQCTYRESENERARLKEAIAQAESTLGELKQLAKMNLENAGELAKASKIGQAMALQQGEIESRLSTLESQIRFATLQSELTPAAMATLMCMEENGYELKETISDKGVITYFQKIASEHQIAVRLQPMVNQSNTWDLLAETFNMSGSACLEELDDFELTMDDLELAQLSREKFRIYPKDDSGLIPEKKGVLPLPSSSSKFQKTRNKTKAFQ